MRQRPDLVRALEHADQRRSVGEPLHCESGGLNDFKVRWEWRNGVGRGHQQSWNAEDDSGRRAAHYEQVSGCDCGSVAFLLVNGCARCDFGALRHRLLARGFASALTKKPPSFRLEHDAVHLQALELGARLCGWRLRLEAAEADAIELLVALFHLLSHRGATADESWGALVHEGELALGFGLTLISAHLNLESTRRRLRRVCCLRRRYRQARAEDVRRGPARLLRRLRRFGGPALNRGRSFQESFDGRRLSARDRFRAVG